MVARAKEKYRSEVASALAEHFALKNPMAVPKLEKIVISMGIGDAHQDKAKLEAAQKQLSRISGQLPAIQLAKKSVSNFKIREGYPAGLKVTLRGDRMYEFLDRLVTLAIPRVRDFRGLNPSGFDGHGNFNMGLIEQSVFPEIDAGKITFTQGMNIAMQTSAETDEQGLELLRLLGMPFRRDQ
jgi:large subunit ribosomal protein L5